MQAYGNLFQGRENVILYSWPARMQGRLRGAAQPRHDLLRHQPQRRIRLWRRNRLRHRGHPFAKRQARHAILAIRCLIRFRASSPAARSPIPSPLRRRIFPTAPHIGPAAINRNNFNAYVQDTWKVTPRFTLDYGVRWDLYTPITERAHRTSSFLYRQRRAGVCRQPATRLPDRIETLSPACRPPGKSPGNLQAHAGGSIMVIPPNIWQDNFLTGSTPFAVYPLPCRRRFAHSLWIHNHARPAAARLHSCGRGYFCGRKYKNRGAEHGDGCESL